MIVDDTALIFEKSRHGRQTHLLPEPDGAPVEKLIPAKHLRKTPPVFPEARSIPEIGPTSRSLDVKLSDWK